MRGLLKPFEAEVQKGAESKKTSDAKEPLPCKKCEPQVRIEPAAKAFLVWGVYH